MYNPKHIMSVLFLRTLNQKRSRSRKLAGSASSVLELILSTTKHVRYVKKTEIR